MGGRHIPRAIVLAAVAVAAAAAPTANASARHAAGPRVELRGTVSPAVAKGLAHVVGTPSATTRVTAVVAFKPRNPLLLHYVAMHSTKRGMSEAQIRSLFLPTASTVGSVRSYLAANGLSVVDSSDMSLVVEGTAASAEHAFGVGLRLYKGASGPVYQAPAGNVRLPSGIASVVQSVAGLDTSLRLHPHYRIVKHAQRGGGGGAPPGLVPQDAPDTPCVGASNVAGASGPYLPADLAGYYGHEADANHEGSGQTIAFVEFSGYRQADANTFKACFAAPAITGVLQPDIVVGGTSPAIDPSGQVEVNLDIEVAMGAARDASYQVYKAANNLALGPTMFNKMRNDNVDIVSDSWGLCEVAVPPKLTMTENTSLEMLAAGGSSLYVASGDSGSADCKSLSPQLKFLAIDDPSSQPFATAVGGTSLNLAGPTEVAWKGSGGGVSYNWPRPAYQATVTANQNNNIPGSFCAGGKVKCRVTPDVAMDAAPARGYVMFSHGFGGGGGSWDFVGGTSAAAPLMAAITADANEANGGTDLGFANPFIYNSNGTGLVAGDFTDITSGNNSNGTGPLFWPAGPGFDMVTGRGSVKGAAFAAALPGYTPAVITFHTSKLTATHPLNLKRVKKGSKVIFSGRLTDTTNHNPLAHRQVLLLNANGRVLGFDGTNLNGVWSIVHKVSKRFTWHAIFMGSAHEKGSTSPSRTVRIKQ